MAEVYFVFIEMRTAAGKKRLGIVYNQNIAINFIKFSGDKFTYSFVLFPFFTAYFNRRSLHRVMNLVSYGEKTSAYFGTNNIPIAFYAQGAQVRNHAF